MKIRKKRILSKSGQGYRVELDDDKGQVKIICLDATRLNLHFKKKHLKNAMEAVQLKTVSEEGATVVYECPRCSQRTVLRTIRSS